MRKKVLPPCLLAVALILFVTTALTCCQAAPDDPEHAADIYDRWEVSNGTLRVRVTAAYEHSQLLAGSALSFESSRPGQSDWQPILSFRHDDPIVVPRENVEFIGTDVAYVFTGWKYAVTTDGGKTWAVWDAEKDLPEWTCCNYGLIEEIELHPDGSGSMRLKLIPEREKLPATLLTKDFGVHWREP